MSMPFLPEEIMIKIFLNLPAEVLHDVMSLVCRSWCKLIRDPVFTEAHFSQSANRYSPLKVVEFNDYFEVCSINKDRTIWKPLRRFNHVYLTHGDGLILTADRDDSKILYLLNPVTNQILRLPNSPREISKKSKRCAIAYSPSTSKCKVVCIDNYLLRAYILTIGVDKEWRELFLKPHFWTYIGSICTYGCPKGVWGFAYWYNYLDKNYIIVLDVEEEIIYKVNFRERVEDMTEVYISVRSDMIPSIIINQNDKCWHFWELVNHKNGGEWRKIGILDFESEQRKIVEITGLQFNSKVRDRFYVLGLKSSDEAVFGCPDYYHYLVYNFKTGTVSQSFNNDSARRNLKLMFTNSLAVLNFN